MSNSMWTVETDSCDEVHIILGIVTRERAGGGVLLRVGLGNLRRPGE